VSRRALQLVSGILACKKISLELLHGTWYCSSSCSSEHVFVVVYSAAVIFFKYIVVNWLICKCKVVVSCGVGGF